jgi:hypothetical protein
MDFAGVRATVTARGNDAIIQERVVRRMFPSDDRKDVISKLRNEQHLFTKRAKY